MKKFAFLLLAFACLQAAALDPIAAQRADLEAVKNDYVLQSLAYPEEGRKAALAHIAAMQKRPTVYPAPVYAAELMRIVAFARNGHDFFDNGKGWSPSRSVPMRLSWTTDGITVMRAAPALARLAGARIVAVEGRSPEQLLAALRAFEGGPDAYIRWNKLWAVEHPAMLHAMGIAKHADRLRIEVVRKDGRMESVVVRAVDWSAQPTDLGRMGAWSRNASERERALGWTNAVTAQEDPLYLREPQRMFRLVDLPDMDALYIQFRGNFDANGEKVAEFAQKAQAELATTTRRHLILDQRFNVGGNSDLTEDLMRQIGRRDKGRTYVLIGPRTFSAGIVSTGIVKTLAGERAVLVGEEVGDRLRWWSEGRHTCLPYSQHCLHLSDGLWDIERGCAGEKACYGDRFGIRVNGLVPQLPAPLTAAAFMSGRDPAMEAVSADLAKQRN